MTGNRRAVVLILVIGLFTPGAGGEVRHDADALVAVGAGVAGTWETEFEFANNESLPLSVFAGEQPHEFVCVTSPCGIAYATLPRTGATRIVTTAADFGRFTGRLFVGAHDAEELPTVRARVVNRARPTQSIELPLFRRSTLVALDPRVLAFPAAVRAAGVHTNLFVSEIELASPVTVLVEAFSAAGGQLGQRTITLAPRRDRLPSGRPRDSRRDGALGRTDPSYENDGQRKDVGPDSGRLRRRPGHRSRREAPLRVGLHLTLSDKKA